VSFGLSFRNLDAAARFQQRGCGDWPQSLLVSGKTARRLARSVLYLSVSLCQIVLTVGDTDKMSGVELASTRGPDAKPADFEQEAVRKSFCLREMGFGFPGRRVGETASA
jgi:hypothetical protein